MSASESPLSMTMAVLRRLERHGLADVPALRARYPVLRDFLSDDLLQHAPHRCLSRLREHAVGLARADVQSSLQRLHDEAHGLPDNVLRQRRSQVLLQLKRIAPGRSTSLSAVAGADGALRTDGPGMAAALKEHWRDTFSARALDRTRRREWFCEDAGRANGLRAAARQMLGDTSAWQLRRSDIRRAVSLTTSSAPGPDGVPYLAWRRLGALAVDTLFDAAVELSEEHGRDSLLEAFPLDASGDTAFNSASM
eukprot:281131-Pyramimonas_sp.AAC.1